jgi:mannitol/fructose-specific phosphotransferase system IIA component (Ntr-type)
VNVKLHALLDEDVILLQLKARNRAEALGEMAARLEPLLPAGLAGKLMDKLLKREELGTTAIGHGVAVPHCRAKGLKAPALLLALSRNGVSFEAVDGELSHVFFLLVSPEDNPGAGLRLLASIAALTRTSRTLASKLLKASTEADVLKTLRVEEEKIRG